MLEAYDLSGIDPEDAPAAGNQAVSWIFSGLGDFLEDYIDLITDSLTAEATPYFITACTIFVAVYGYSVIYGWVETSTRQFTKDIAKLALIMIIFFNWDWFLPQLTELFFDDPAELSTTLLNAVVSGIGHDGISNASAVSILDTIALTAFGYWGAAIANWDFLEAASWVGVIEAVVLMLAVFYMVIYSVFLLMKSFLIMTIFLSLGQLFIPFLLFDKTRGVGLAWWNQMTTYMFIPLFTLMLLTLVFAIGYYQYQAMNIAVAGGAPIQASNLLGSIFISIIGGLAMKEVPDLARAVGGGFAFGGGNGYLGRSMAGAAAGMRGINKFYKSIKARRSKGTATST
jgi:type IV secretion system protein VirB6